MCKRLVTMMVATALFVGVAWSAQSATIRVASWLPPSHPIMKDMMRPWARQVEEASGGRLEVKVLDSPLGGPPAHFDIARDGIADVTYGVHGYTPGRFELTAIAELPFLSNSAEALSVAYWRVHQQYLAQANEHQGVKVIAVFTHGPGEIFNSVQPVDDLDDLKGLKLRVGGGAINEIAKELGVVPIHAPSPKSYEILSKGVADGIMFPAESVPFFKLEKILEYMTVVPDGLYNTSFFVVMNQDTYDGLSAAEQRAVDSVSGEAFARMAGQAWDAADARGMEVIRKEGIGITRFDGAVMARLRQQVAFAEQRWLEKAAERGVDGEAALQMLRREIANLTGS